MRKYTYVAGLAVALSFMGASGVAQAQEGSSYVIASLGSSTTDLSGISGSATGFRLGYGKRISKDLAVEGFYVSSGKASATSYYGSTSYETVTANTTVFQVQAVGYVPLNPKTELFGKVGLAMWSTAWTYKDIYLGSLYAADSGTEKGNDLVFGFGADYKLDSGDKLRFEYESLATKISGTNASVTTLGIGYTHEL